MKKHILLKTVVLTLVLNILLTLIKLVFGILGRSESLVSDGINSLVDVLVSLLLLIVLKIAQRRPDKTHPYGHEKFEGIMYLILSIMIMVTAFSIFGSGVVSLVSELNNPSMQAPEIYTLYVAGISLIIKLGLFILTFKVGSHYQSESLKADSKNHLFDLLATLLSLVSISLAQFGWRYFEPLASILIACIILYVGIKMIMDAIKYLVDEAPSEITIDKITQIIKSVDGVIKIDDLKVRRHMNQYYVDVEIAVLNNLSLEAAHQIAESVHILVEAKMDVIHCMVHVNPYGDAHV